MKRKHTIFLAVIATLLGGLLLLLVILQLSGIRRVHFHHVIATVEFIGLDSSCDANVLEEHIKNIPAMREISFTRASWSHEAWMARLQFKAEDPIKGAQQLRIWLASLPGRHTARLIKATYYHCRLSRPACGDIVVGEPQALPTASGTS